MWKYDDTSSSNAIDFIKDGEIKLQIIKDDDIEDEDIELAKKVVEALNKCEV